MEQNGSTATQPALGGVALANPGTRAAGYLIDLIPAIILGLFGFIPILGAIIAGIFLMAYWLLRDITGRSLGKMLLGMEVVKSDGSPSTVGSRIVRNFTIAVGPALLAIPLLGYLIGPPVALILMLVEVIMLLSQGNRLGDRLAGTTVIKR